MTTPKTLSSVRDVFIQDELLSVCKKILLMNFTDSIVLRIDAPKLLFSNDIGTHISFYAYNKYLHENSVPVLHRAITPHTLRHTHASLLMEQGVGIDTISRRLGHEDSKITREIYLHVTEKLKEKENEQLRNIQVL